MADNSVRSTLTNPNGSESAIDITDGDSTVTLANGINISSYHKAKLVNGFYIAPKTVGTIKVQLSNQLDGESFVIPTEMVTAYVGTWIPMKIVKVYATGTTATGVIGW